MVQTQSNKRNKFDSTSASASASTFKVHSTVRDDEVILFRTPEDASGLFVSNLSPKVSLEQMTDLFTQYGLLHEIKVTVKVDDADPSDTYAYAFVRYYSKVSARRARKALQRDIVQDRPMNIARINRQKRNTHANQLLPLARMVRLANYYLGYAGWSCEILAIEQEDYRLAKREMDDMHGGPMEEKTQGHGNRNSERLGYRCDTKLTVNTAGSGGGEGFAVYASGYGAACGHIKDAMEKGKKVAVSNAYKVAFDRVALVCLGNGKCLAMPIPEQEQSL